MIDFLNSFMSYLLLVIVIVLVAGIAIFIGITLAKNKNRTKMQGTENMKKDEENNV